MKKTDIISFAGSIEKSLNELKFHGKFLPEHDKMKIILKLYSRSRKKLNEKV